MDSCNFPTLNPGQHGNGDHEYLPIDLEAIRNVAAFGENHGVKLETFFLGVWSIILRQFADVEVACFGHISEGNLRTCIVDVNIDIAVQHFLRNIKPDEKVKANSRSFNTAVCVSADEKPGLDLEQLVSSFL